MTELLFSSTNIMITMDAVFAAADNESWGMDVISLRPLKTSLRGPSVIGAVN